eukprot:509192-Alexandrium_andersonii.AAC.1
MMQACRKLVELAMFDACQAHILPEHCFGFAARGFAVNLASIKSWQDKPAQPCLDAQAAQKATALRA